MKRILIVGMASLGLACALGALSANAGVMVVTADDHTVVHDVVVLGDEHGAELLAVLVPRAVGDGAPQMAVAARKAYGVVSAPVVIGFPQPAHQSVAPAWHRMVS